MKLKGEIETDDSARSFWGLMDSQRGQKTELMHFIAQGKSSKYLCVDAGISGECWDEVEGVYYDEHEPGV